MAAPVPKSGSKVVKKESEGLPSPPPASVEENLEPLDPIAFSGIWLAGNEKDWARRFPVAKDFVMTRRSDSGEGEFGLTKVLTGRLKAAKREGGRRIVDALSDQMLSAKDGKALVMACVVNHEYSHTRTVGVGRGAIKTVFADVFADLVICDFSDMSVVARFPFRITRKDVVKGGKSDAEAGQEQLRAIYAIPPVQDFAMGGDKHRGLDYWTNRDLPLADNGKEKGVALPIHLVTGALNVAKYGMKMLAFQKVAVRKVNVMPDADAALHPYFKPFKEEYFASLFASNFFDGVGVATLPYSKGNEIVFSMMVEELSDAMQVKMRSRREADSKDVTFSLGRADYDIDLVFPIFQTVPRGDIAQCCAYSRIILSQNELPIYSAQHDANQQMVVSRGTKGASWEAYADATCEMFFRAGPIMLKAIQGKEVSESKPVKVIKPSDLRQFFLQCSPESILNSKK